MFVTFLPTNFGGPWPIVTRLCLVPHVWWWFRIIKLGQILRACPRHIWQPKKSKFWRNFGQHLDMVLIISCRTRWDRVKLRSWFWVGRNSGPIIHHLWNKVPKSKFACARVFMVCSAFFDWRFLFAFWRYSRSVVQHLAEILPFWVTKCFWEGPKSLTLFVVQFLPLLLPPWKDVHKCRSVCDYKWYHLLFVVGSLGLWETALQCLSGEYVETASNQSYCWKNKLSTTTDTHHSLQR